MKTHPFQSSLLATLAVTLTNPAHAQDAFLELDPTTVTAEALDGVALDNQVTAFRTETPLIDVPQSLTVFGNDQIEEQAITSIGEIVDYTPGVTNSQGEGHRDAVVFRGIRSTADFFVDGVRDDVQYFRPVYNLEQVEILRGPNALSFGRGGSGGVLNRVTKKAELDGNFGELKGTIDTFGGSLGQFDYNLHATDNAAVRLNVFRESLENHRDFFDGDRLGINPTVTLKLAEETTLHLSYEYNDHERFIDRGIPSGDNGRPLSQFSGTTFGDSELNETTLEAHVFQATLKHNFSDFWKGRVTASYGNYNKVYSNYFPSDFNEATNQVEIDGYIDRTDRNRFTLSGDLVGEFDTGSIGHKVLIGAEYINTSSDQNRFNNVFSTNGDDQEFFDADGFRISNGVVRDGAGNVLATGTFTDLNDDTEVELDVYSFFVQDEIKITEQLHLLLGARFDSFDIEVLDNETGNTLTRRDEEVTPRIGLVYKPVENLSFYGSYSETFLPRSGEQFSDINPPADGLDPDEFSNLEIGVKWDFLDNFSFTLSGFRIEGSSLQPSSAVPGTFNVIDAETFGFETQLKGNLTDWWHISAAYSYLNGEQDGTNLRPREQPRSSVSIWNNFKVNEDFGFGLGMIYQSSSFADNGNNATLPSYVRFDASAYYEISEDLRLQVNIENLLDRDYFPTAHIADNITVGAPINATFTVSKKF